MTPSIIPRISQVKALTKDELDRATSIWIEAFRDNDFCRACTGANSIFYERFMSSVLLAAIRGGEVYFATSDDALVGVAAWFPPGRALLDSPDQGKGGFDDLFADFTPELRTWWMEYMLPKYEKQTTECLGEGVKVANWHLQFIGVRQAVQRRGIGSALIDVVAKKAQADKKILCVETEIQETVAFYEKCGFVVKDPVEEYLSDVNNFKMWVMATKST